MKDAEIARLTADNARLDERSKNADGVASRLLQERDALLAKLHGKDALPPTSPLFTDGPKEPQLPAEVEIFLDARFVAGTPLWRQQRQEAVKLAEQDMDAEKICDVLARGQEVPY